MNNEKPSLLMLRTIPFFQEMTDAELEELSNSMWLESRRRGYQLTERRPDRQDSGREIAYFVYSGVVAVYTLTRRGGRKILFFQGAGKLLNQHVMNPGQSNLYGEVAADTLFICMSCKSLRENIGTSPALTRALLAHYEANLWRLSHQLKNTVGSLYVERKLAAKLLKLSSDFGRPRNGGVVIGFDLTIKQVADYVGSPRETVSRACGRLTGMGLIQYQNRRFFLPDRTRLEEFRRQA